MFPILTRKKHDIYFAYIQMNKVADITSFLVSVPLAILGVRMCSTGLIGVWIGLNVYQA